jgi:repressor LexA
MTQRQREIADFIERFWTENWTSPNVRQIASALGISSTATVHHHLVQMTRMGILERKEVSDMRILYRRRYPGR